MFANVQLTSHERPVLDVRCLLRFTSVFRTSFASCQRCWIVPSAGDTSAPPPASDVTMTRSTTGKPSGSEFCLKTSVVLSCNVHTLLITSDLMPVCLADVSTATSSTPPEYPATGMSRKSTRRVGKVTNAPSRDATGRGRPRPRCEFVCM